MPLGQAESDHDRAVVALAGLRHGQRIGVWVGLFVDKLHVKVLGHEDGDHAQVQLCKSLPKANAFAPDEGTESRRFALRAFRCQEERAGAVEAFGEKLMRALPLVLVPVHAEDVDLNVVACFNVEAADFGILGQSGARRVRYWRHDPQGF